MFVETEIIFWAFLHNNVVMIPMAETSSTRV